MVRSNPNSTSDVPSLALADSLVNGGSGHDSPEEESFVILSQDSFQNGGVGAVGGSGDGSSSMELRNPLGASAFITPYSVSSLSSDELVASLEELLHENGELKDTIQQNNDAMHQQHRMLTEWRSKVAAIHKLNQQKFDETRQLVLRLREENNALKLAVNDGTSGVSQLQSQLSLSAQHERELEEECCQLRQLQDQLNTEISSLRQDWIEMKHAHELTMEEKQKLNLRNEELRGKVEALRHCLQEQDEQLKQAMKKENKEDEQVDYVFLKSLLPAPEMVSSEVQVDFLREDDKIGELLALLETEQAKNQRLTSLLHFEKEKLNSTELRLKEQVALTDRMEAAARTPVMARQGEQLVESIRSSEDKLTRVDSVLERYKASCDNLESLLDVYQTRLDTLNPEDDTLIQQLQTQVEELRTALKREQAQSELHRDNFRMTQERCNAIITEYEKLSKTLDENKKELDSKDRQYRTYQDVQNKHYSEKVDVLTAQIFEMEEKLAEKTRQMEKLQLEVKTGGGPKVEDEIELLRQQLELYQTDFRIERESREAMAAEKTRLEEQIQQLREENHQLRDELQQFRQQPNSTLAAARQDDRHGAIRRPTASVVIEPSAPAETIRTFIPANRWRRRNEEQNLQTSGNVANFTGTCPLCNLGFTNQQALQNHVESCLEANDGFR